MALGQQKKLIEFGWDEPDTAFMRQHVREMEKRPFNGVVFDIAASSAGGQRARFLDLAWGKHRFNLKELQSAVDDLRGTKFEKFTENFLRFDVTPGDVDWFEDFSSVARNAGLAARVAKLGKARGILFDCEAYNKPLWNYHKQRDSKSKSFEQYAAQTRKCGGTFMRMIQQEYPDITIFLTFGYSIAYAQCNGDKSKLSEIEYALYPAFLDGMLDVAGPAVRIVDGYEISYAFKTPPDFDNGLKIMRSGALPFVADPEKHRQHFRAGFGVWMDQDWRKHGWDVNDFSKNFFTPEAFENSVRLALQRCDEYVWIYTEKPKWWTQPAGQAADLPSAYEEALKRALETPKP